MSQNENFYNSDFYKSSKPARSKGVEVKSVKLLMEYEKTDETSGDVTTHKCTISPNSVETFGAQRRYVSSNNIDKGQFHIKLCQTGYETPLFMLDKDGVPIKENGKSKSSPHLFVSLKVFTKSEFGEIDTEKVEQKLSDGVASLDLSELVGIE